MAAKAALYLAMREARMNNVQLARTLACDEREVRRMLDPRHPTKLPRIKEALEVLGKRLVVSVEALFKLLSSGETRLHSTARCQRADCEGSVESTILWAFGDDRSSRPDAEKPQPGKPLSHKWDRRPWPMVANPQKLGPK